MLDYINNVFGIENEISAPILISLIVFIIGGLSTVLLKYIVNFSERKNTRNSFKSLIDEIAKKSLQQSKNIDSFTKTLKIENKGDWKLKYTRITYLNLVFQQDFSLIYYSFRKLFNYRLKKEVRYKAFNRIWSALELLKYVEKSITEDFGELMKKFNQYETKFHIHLDDLRKLNDQYLKPYKGRKIEEREFNNKDEFNYIISRVKIFKEWENNDPSIIRQRFVIMKEIINPLHELNKNKSKIEGAMELNNLLLNTKYEYEQMENLLKVSKKMFINYYWNYNSSNRILKKALDIIK